MPHGRKEFGDPDEFGAEEMGRWGSVVGDLCRGRVGCHPRVTSLDSCLQHATINLVGLRKKLNPE